MLAVATLAACDNDGSGQEPLVSVVENPDFAAGTTMAELAEAGTITIGVRYDQPGFGEVGLSGTPEGFDIEIGRIIAAQLGIAPGDIVWKEATAGTREELLVDGEVDLVIATYTITSERKKQVGFAGPYYLAGQQMMVLAGDTTITGPDSLKTNPDEKVCSAKGSTPAETIKTYLADPDQLVTYDTYEECTTALEDGTVQAVTTDNAILLGLVSASDGAFALVGDPFTEEPYGIGIHKSDNAFCTFIDDTLLSASENGSYQQAWTATAGQVPESRTPNLPQLDPCT